MAIVLTDLVEEAMNDDDYRALRVVREGQVTWVTLDHPPINLLDATLVPELKDFVARTVDDTTTKVVVFRTSDPDFFAAHVDARYMLDASGFVALGVHDGPTELNPMQHLVHAVRFLPQVTIGELQGRLRGGANEFAMAMDLRFAAAGTTWLSQVESRMGIIPGGGGTQLLPALVGRARALEIILTGDLVDAATAERWGWVNRAVPPEALADTVRRTAERIAGLTWGQVRAAKQAVDAALGNGDLAAQLTRESAALGLVYPPPQEVVDRMARALDRGLQRRESELDLERALDEVS